MDSRKQKLILIGVLCLVVVCLSIGYAMLSSMLRIDGTANVGGEKWSVEFVEKQAKTIPKGKATCEIGNITGTSITNMSAVFQLPGDSCTFTIPVENAGTLDASLVDVDGKATPLNLVGSQEDIAKLNSQITYDVQYGNTKIDNLTTFDNIDTLEPGERETITLKVEFREEATQIPAAAVTIEGLDRTFNFQNKTNSSSTNPSPTTTPVYHDNSGANKPILSENMIPVVYDETKREWVKQDLDKSYDYSQQVWANAVTVVEEYQNKTRNYYKLAKPGTVIPMDAINTMWVWIPRYSYTIKSEDGNNYYGKASSDNENPTQALPGEIDVKFIPVSENDTEGSAQYTGEEASGWFTPPGFTFGDKDLSGVWIGKFETGSIDGTSPGDVETDNLVAIKPNITSWRNIRVSTLELVSMGLTKDGNIYGFDQNTYDAHASKNSEWALMSYLTQSKYGKYGNSLYTGENKQVYMNNYGGYMTGCSSGKATAGNETTCENTYDVMVNRQNGQGYAGAGASSTGNIYGIYDASGGAWEYTMGVLNKMSGNTQSWNSGYPGLLTDGTSFTGNREWPADKYVDVYMSEDTKIACKGTSCNGHALNETSGYYGDYYVMVDTAKMWLVRGGGSRYSNSGVGIFSFGNNYGNAYSDNSFRIVLAPNN